LLYRRLALEWLLVLLAASLLVGFAAVGAWTQAADNRLYDLAQRWAARPADERILIVEIDDASLSEIGRWPWPRARHAALLRRLAEARPLAIGYDVLFLEPSPDDTALAMAMRQAGNVYLPALVQREIAGAETVSLPAPGLAAVAQVGVAEVILDAHDGVRQADTQIMVGGREIPQMVTMLARRAQPGLVLPKQQPFLLPLLPADAFRRVPFAQVLKGEVPPAIFRDKIVLVGSTAGGMGDIYTVPSSAGGLLSGVQIQANLLNALLGGRTIVQVPQLLLVALSLLPVWLMMVAFLRFRPAVNLRLSLIVPVALIAVSMALIPLAGIWVPPGAALLGILLVHILWGWRRLAATSQFIGRQAAMLEADPGIAPQTLQRGPMTDRIAHEARQLQGIIAQLRTLRLFTADVIERLPDATLVTDESETIMLANQAADQLFGGDAQGHPLDVFLARICTGATLDGNRISCPGGLTLIMTDAPLSGGGRIVRFADMTDLQRATDEREEVLQFLTHDLRSPHASILTLLETQRTASGGSIVPSSVIDRIRSHARHGLRLAS
jgi:CHASE2 domain-containing sensor protein